MGVKFSYPNVTSPTTELDLANTNEQFPYQRPVRKLQSAYDTDAGATVIYDWGFEVRTFSIELHPLTQAEVASLRSFFTDTVNGRALPFDFTDGRGVVWTVRFSQDVFNELEDSYNVARVSLTLREL